MRDWQLEIAFHWPHDRLALGWDIMRPDGDYDYYKCNNMWNKYKGLKCDQCE